MYIPMEAHGQIIFWMKFEKGKKKSTKDLYRLRFSAERDSSGESEKTDYSNTPIPDADIEFLCTGFLEKIKEFGDMANNPVLSLVL